MRQIRLDLGWLCTRASRSGHWCQRVLDLSRDQLSCRLRAQYRHNRDVYRAANQRFQAIRWLLLQHALTIRQRLEDHRIEITLGREVYCARRESGAMSTLQQG